MRRLRGKTARAWSTPTTSSAAMRSTATRKFPPTRPATAACEYRSPTPRRSTDGPRRERLWTSITKAAVALHRKDRMLWREAHPQDEPDIEMEDGGVFEVADVTLEVIHAPGHSPGSVCLYCEDLGVVFTGHVLRVHGPVPDDGEFPDFPGQLTAIGEHLLTLPSDTRVLPGEGEETTVAAAAKKFDSWFAAGPDPSALSGLTG